LRASTSAALARLTALVVCQQLQNGRQEVVAHNRIASLATAAALLPISDAVGDHEFTSSAFNAKLQLADRTMHQPLRDAARPYPHGRAT